VAVSVEITQASVIRIRMPLAQRLKASLPLMLTMNAMQYLVAKGSSSAKANATGKSGNQICKGGSISPHPILPIVSGKAVSRAS
jgi:hypothetical protein